MCLILFSFQPNTPMPLILGANRDEFFARPTLPANYWENYPNVLAGKDQVAGGTWIGITKTGRFAALTNIREAGKHDQTYRAFSGEASIQKLGPITGSLKSRGRLTQAFLTGSQSCQCYLSRIVDDLQDYQNSYAGFNLLIGEFTLTQQSLFYLNNREEGFQQLTAGSYGLSNHRLNTPWPKVINGKQALDDTLTNIHRSSLSRNSDATDLSAHKAVRKILENPTLAADNTLPTSGLSYKSEKALSANFIKMPLYGTRASTVITINKHAITFSEKNYLAGGESAGQSDKIPATKNLVKKSPAEKHTNSERLTKETTNKNTQETSNPKQFTLPLY
jgi:uncharacterized protein with NRDE domain